MAMLVFVKSLVFSTTMCGAGLLQCPECHPSCSSCGTSGICTSCAAGVEAASFVNGAACMCVDGKGTKESFFSSYHQACGSCPAMCATCHSDSGDKCYTCAVSSAVVVKSNTNYGQCDCAAGYVPNDRATVESDCVPCAPSNCQYCTGPAEDNCFASEEAELISRLGFGFGVPETTATKICYNTPLEFPAGCEQSLLEDIMGPLTKDAAGVYTPTKPQCDNLLRSIWPASEHWFNRIFPAFDPATKTFPRSYFKAYLIIVMLTFSPATLLNHPDWTVLIAAINAPATEWKNYLFWGGANLGYTKDGGVTALEFPPSLKAWLQPKCPLAICPMFVMFNSESTVCSNQSCTLSAVCQATAIGSPCSFS